MASSTHIRLAFALLAVAASAISADAAAAPLPEWQQRMFFLFNNSELCTLGTAHHNGTGISLEQSLMFFTFSHEDGVMAFTSKPDGKVQNLLSSGTAAVMLNSFEGKAATNALLADETAVAMTVYGKAAVLKPGADEARLRTIQEEAHPQFAGAFSGNGTVVFTVTVDRILVVDVKGEATRVSNPLTPETAAATVVAA